MQRHIAITLAAVTAALLTFSCASGQKTVLQPTSAVPAAQGNVETTTTPDGNTALTVQVKHLAPPEKVASGASTYVVWAKPMAANAEAQNLGALTVDKDRMGELRTLTPLKSFEVVVTAEASGKVMAPSSAEVLKATVAR